jgi:uncharacterized integral membrane protein
MSTTPPPVQVRPKGRTGLATGTIVKLAVAGVIGLILLVFILQNTESVEWSFLFWGFTLNKWVMLVGALLVGFLAGMLVSTLLWRRRRAEARRRGKAV